VEFKTDAINNKSRSALLRIGAKEEGILRSHMITPKGRVRDTVYYSILASEWLEVKGMLEEKMRGDGANL
jgi:RimJ/RimL family protein N-acetyltransferase